MPDTNQRAVCFFNSCKTWGGGEKWHFDVATHLDTKKFRVVLFSNPGSKLLNKASAHSTETIALRVNNFSFLNPFKIRRLAKIFRKYQFHAIILNLPSDLKLAGIAARKAGIKRVIYRRGSAIPVKNSAFNRFLFKHIVTEIIANSEQTKQTICEENPNLFDQNKIMVVYNGIDVSMYPRKEKLTAKFTKTKQLTIGNVGRLDPQKAQHYLIELSTILAKTKIPHKIKIAGDGHLKENLQRQIEKYNVQDSVTLIGFAKDIPGFLQQIDVFVLTSRWEGFGYVIAEAMAAYKPVIAFDLSSNPELIDHGKTGFLIPPFNLEAMANAIQKFWNDENTYTQFALNAREKVEKCFTKQRMLKEIAQLLEQN